MIITLIKQRDAVALVEYIAGDGTPERVWIPVNTLKGSKG